MRRDARLLVDALRSPETACALNGEDWSDLISMARAEALHGTLAHRLADMELPAQVKAVLKDARDAAVYGHVQALWEADCARRALAGTGVKCVLMKGTAYVAAGLDAGIGRQIGDLDIMVAANDLPATEAALLAAGWEWVKPDPYDDRYYRDHMHELPPLIHRERDRMIDVHHTTLPLTARPTPDAQAMRDTAMPLESGLYVMAPADMVLHAVAHLFADGDLAGGLRNLWDIDRLLRQFSSDNPDFWELLGARAEQHQLAPHCARALRLAVRLYATPVDEVLAGRARFSDKLYKHRLLARDGFGRETRSMLRQAFYVRSHALRMPPLMLARHLWTKWRKGKAASG